MKKYISKLKTNIQKDINIRGMNTRNVFLLAFLICALPLLAHAQFNSGSTGADGALDLSTTTCPSSVCIIQLPESGILNYTTINIRAGRILQFKKNSRNTPVTILAQGDVNIEGWIYLDASGNVPGPGGFYGGQAGSPGFGPGGGTASFQDGRWVGPLSLIPIVGGSGGGGSSYQGGGGGGAIVIASSTSITMAGIINAQGGTVFSISRGSGGAIRLVANQLNISGAFNATGNTPASNGVVRLEAQPGQLTFTGISNPSATLSPVNPNIISSSQPSLMIASVGGYAVPTYGGSRFDTIDLLLPNQIPDPVNVVVQAVNIPSGTQVQVGFVSGSPNGTSTTCTLTGGPGPLSCTATISNLNRTGVTYLLATAVFVPPAPITQFNPKGADQIDQIRLESVLGAKPKYVFLRKDKSSIEIKKLPKAILEYFGI